MFKPFKTFLKYIHNLHKKSSNEEELIDKTKTISKMTTLPSTSVVVSSSYMESRESSNMEKVKLSGSIENNKDEQQSHNHTQNIDNSTQLLTDAQYNDYDEDDIETQIKSSIMLKKPLKSDYIRTETSSPLFNIEIVSPNYKSNDVEDDELEDFRYAPTEDLKHVSHNETEKSTVKSATILKQIEENEEVEIEIDEEIESITSHKLNDREFNNAEINDEVDGVGDEEEPFINLKSITNSQIIVNTGLLSTTCLNNDNTNGSDILSNGDINAISNNGNDDNDNVIDPLEIAQEDHEAFSVVRTSVLKQLNLLKPLGLGQDDEDDAITVTTDGEMECWLYNDENDNEMPHKDKQPLVDRRHNLDEGGDNENKPSSSCVDERGDGSDSGLGSETSTLQITTESIHETSQILSLNTSTNTIIPEETCNSNSVTVKSTTTQNHTVYNNNDEIKRKDIRNERHENIISEPSSSLSSLILTTSTKDASRTIRRSNLKRRFNDGKHNSTNLNALNVIRNNAETTASSTATILCHQKKPKRSISFNSVHIYYFARQQGFTCVPSTGGCTLGMAAIHDSFKIMSLAEHTAELRRAHRLQLQEINPRGSSSDDSEESEEDFLSEGSGSDLDGESNGFLQPVSPKQRRAILKAAGIRKIDPTERAECRDIRNSREICGCKCRNYCDPETCSCSKSGIKCQVDRGTFPCFCTRESCSNPIGRVEFNSDRVHTHYRHTLLRLEMENSQENRYHIHHTSNILESTTSSATPVLASATDTLPMHPSTSCSFYQNHILPQSNYSSGYASPAYNIAGESTQSTLPDLNGDYYNHNSLQDQQNSAHLYDPHLTGTHTPIINQYNVDDLDTNLYSTSTTSVSAPACSYATHNTTTASINSSIADDTIDPYHNIDYNEIPSRRVSPTAFNVYHNTNVITNNNYMNTTNDISVMMGGTSCLNTYSSCAVPSDPPYGTATTTESSIIEFTATSHLVTALETTTAPSCVTLRNADIENNMETEQSPNFINALHGVTGTNIIHNNNDNNENNNQINDLLQHVVPTTTINRHIPLATMTVSINTTNIQQLHMDIGKTTMTTPITITPTTAEPTMKNLRHCEIHTGKIINSTQHNNLLDQTVAKSTVESNFLNTTLATTTSIIVANDGIVHS